MVYIRFGSVDTGILLEVGSVAKPPFVLGAASGKLGSQLPSAAVGRGDGSQPEAAFGYVLSGCLFEPCLTVVIHPRALVIRRDGK